MTLIIHIIIALSSIAVATYVFFRPSTNMLRSAYVTVGLTFVTGFYLVWMTPSHMLQACTSGLVYLSIVSLAIIAARVKLARQLATNIALDAKDQ